jgi:hypothetical protein
MECPLLDKISRQLSRAPSSCRVLRMTLVLAATRVSTGAGAVASTTKRV